MSEIICETPEGCIKFRVEYEYEPAERGSRGSWGEPLEPDYPESVSIDTPIDFYDLALADAWCSGVGWTHDEISKHAQSISDQVEESCFDDVHDAHQSRLEDIADAQYEAMKDRRMGL